MEIGRRSARTATVSLFLFALAGCSAGNMNAAPQHPASPSLDFGTATCKAGLALVLTPTHATITAGQNVRVTAELTSICGLTGTIDVGIRSISPPPSGNNGFTFTQSRYDVPLGANGSAGAYITFGATAATLKTIYTVTVAGEDISGCCHGLEQTEDFALTVK